MHQRVYTGTRQPLTYADARVTPGMFDVTDRTQIQATLDTLDALDNAGCRVADDSNESFGVRAAPPVNLYGTLDVTRVALALLTRGRGAVVNIVSVGAVAAIAAVPAYSISKAAPLSLRQSLRALLVGNGVSVYPLLPGAIDTARGRGAMLNAVERGDEDIFPDSMSQLLAEGWRMGVAKTLERQSAALVTAEPIAA